MLTDGHDSIPFSCENWVRDKCVRCYSLNLSLSLDVDFHRRVLSTNVNVCKIGKHEEERTSMHVRSYVDFTLFNFHWRFFSFYFTAVNVLIASVFAKSKQGSTMANKAQRL